MAPLVVVLPDPEPGPTSLELQPGLLDYVVTGTLPPLLLIHDVEPVVSLPPVRQRELLQTRQFIESRGVRVYRDDRSGGVSYHGPGSMIAVPMVLTRDARTLAFRIADALVATLADFGLTATYGEFPGAWVNGKAIGFVGVQTLDQCSGGGVALNANLDLAPFQWLNPCGSHEVPTSMHLELGAPVDEQQLRRSFVQHLLGDVEWVTGVEALALRIG